MEIEGAAALVTGGNRGIGEAFVRALLAAGAARVYVGTRDVANAAALVDELGERAVPIRLDITDADQVVQAARRCSDVSILVNNAGAFTGITLLGAPDMAAARDEMETNYFGPLAMCRAFAPVLARHPQSAIVNVLSAGGLVAVPAMGGYSPSKFAARAMTTCVRAELAPQGTTVSALIVGSVDTRMAADVVGLEGDAGEHRRTRGAGDPQGHRRDRHRPDGRSRCAPISPATRRASRRRWPAASVAACRPVAEQSIQMRSERATWRNGHAHGTQERR